MRLSGFKHFESSKNKFPDIKTVNVDDFVVLIGKDALSNDYLSINMAKDDDLWFHAKGFPGSHVVIRVNDNLPTPETIKKVAYLAAKNSKAKGLVRVVYCKSKFVKKLRDMKPGQVQIDYVNSQEIEIDI